MALRSIASDWSRALSALTMTTLDNGGVSLADMMEFMGHSRKGQPITIGVYSHVTDETFERARQAAPGGTVTELRAAQLSPR
jgi:hypothetical protein